MPRSAHLDVETGCLAQLTLVRRGVASEACQLAAPLVEDRLADPCSSLLDQLPGAGEIPLDLRSSSGALGLCDDERTGEQDLQLDRQARQATGPRQAFLDVCERSRVISGAEERASEIHESRGLEEAAGSALAHEGERPLEGIHGRRPLTVRLLCLPQREGRNRPIEVVADPLGGLEGAAGALESGP